MHEPPSDDLDETVPDWPLSRTRPTWWASPDDRDRAADAAAAFADSRDQAATGRDEAAACRGEAAAARECDATAWLTAAHRRLIEADSQGAQRLAAALAAGEEARTAYADTATEECRLALIEAEAECEAETVHSVRTGIERRSIRQDLDRAAQHLAASASDRRAAAGDRNHAQADRQAAGNDRDLAGANRQQSALDRAADPDRPLYS